MSEPPDTSEADPSGAGLREARYRHSESFPVLLKEAGCSLLVSTYQAGKLIAIGVAEGGLSFSFQSFDQAMGVAASPQGVAVGARGQIWHLRDSPDIAARLPPAGRFDHCYLPRSTTVTGSIHCHEVAWGETGGGEPELWVVNTLFSCLATLDPDYSFVPRWRPPFVSALAAEDRCHLNGLAMRAGRPAFVTAMAQSDTGGGWREDKNETGCVIDVDSGELVTAGMAMPHSPRWHRDRLYVLNSGHGALEAVHMQSGERTLVARVPGYARGLACHGDLAFVGLSRIRETNVFGGVPVAGRERELKCGVGVVDLRTGRTLATLEFESGVEEIFDVQVLPGVRCPALSGESPQGGEASAGEHEIWVVPPEPGAPSRVAAAAGAESGEGAEAPDPGDRADLQLSDEQVAAMVAEALAMQGAGRTQPALELLRRASQARPRSAELLNHLGNALQDAGDQEAALRCYRRAVAADSGFAPALQNLGYVLVARGRTDEGVGWLHRAQAVAPQPVNRALIATALPVVYSSAREVDERRTALEERVAAMVADGLEIDAADSLVPTSFFTAYQGRNDRELAEQLGRVYRGRTEQRAGSGAARARGGRPRIGFLSAHFRDHTIGRLNLGRIAGLDRERLEVVVLAAGAHDDPVAAGFEAAADRFVPVPRDVAAARRLIADEELDLLFFADVGMDALTYTLAFSRMAPVQCATWGHPVTTGSPQMDLFLSSDLLEVAEADSHYSEELVRRPTLCTRYVRPRVGTGAPSRIDLGLPAEGTLYVCPQTLFKFHPDFDRPLGEILRGDPGAELALIRGRAEEWTEQLDERLRLSLPEGRQIRWIDPLPRERFLALLATADVVLDTFHFGGGNTTYEALGLGKPVVTLPSRFLRGRITQGLYAKAGYTELVADTPERYVELALELGTDPDRRDRVGREIAEACSVLYEDDAEVRDFEDFLADAAG